MNASAAGQAPYLSPICWPVKCRTAAAFAVLVFLLAACNEAWADTVITDCTELTFHNAVAGGGTVTFSNDCSITLTQPITVNTNVTVDAAGHNVTISGGGSVPIFIVSNIILSNTLSLNGLTLSNGKSTGAGGAIYVNPGATLNATNCVFTGNKVVGPDGAAGAAGANDPVFAFNGGNGNPGGPALGGAIWNGGTLRLFGCALSNNVATAGNGGAGGAGGNSSDSLGVAGNGGNGGPGGGAYGGAIYNGGSLTLTNSLIADCIVANNSSTGGNGGSGGAAGTGAFGGRAGQGGTGSNGAGAGVFNGQNLTVHRCTFYANISTGGNSATAGTQSSGIGSPGLRGADGVGAALSSTGWSAITNSTFYTNITIGGSGGNGGPGTGNLSRGGAGGDGGNAIGGGVQNSGTMNLKNCTFSTCGAYGGTNGVAGTGAFTNDNGVVGQALGGNIANTGGTCTLMNSLIVYGQYGSCGFGSFNDGGYNMTSDTSIALTSGLSFPNTANILLGGLGMNGGPTPTVPLFAGSPAIDRIPPDRAPLTDQRGVPRPIPSNGSDDIGAFESAATSAPVIVIQPIDSAVTQRASATFSVFAVGQNPLGYQWFFNGSAITNATGSNYTIPSVGTNNVGSYFVQITNKLGSITSDSVSLYLKPTITSQPTNIALPFGTDATFSISATGDPAPSYQWSFNGSNIPGATDDTLLVAGVQLSDIGTYSVKVINPYGTNSASAQLEILPTILSPPTDQVLVPGSSAVFSVYAVGSPTLFYQWQFNGINVPGATNTTLSLIDVQQTNIGSYRVVVTNPVGSATSDPARIDMAPFVTQQPKGQLVLVGSAATFSVQVGGSFPLVYLWYFNGNPIAGATTNSYKIPSAQTNQIGAYWVLVTNAFGAGSSAQARLDLLPTITTPPISQTVPVGAPASFYVAASGNQPLSYQWQLNGVNLTGQTGTRLTIDSVQSANVGAYSVFVANSVGSTSSPPAALAIGDAYTIRGFVRESALGLSNVMVVAGGYTNFTGPDGSYVITLTSGSYTVTPSQGCHLFNPSSRTVSIGPSIDQVNFLAYTNDIFTVQGRVTLDGIQGISGVTIAVGDRTAVTDTTGNYTLSHVCPALYSVTPMLQGYGFQPASLPLQLQSDTNGLSFVGFPVYTLEGYITQNDIGISNVTVQAGTQSTNTDATGAYVLANLRAGAYTVTPSQACRMFNPAYRTVSLVTNTAGINFYAIDNNVFALRGNVTEGTYPVAGVSLQMGDLPLTTTDSNGAYAFVDVCGASYTITPSLAGYTFQPSNLTVSATTDLYGLNFAAIPVFYISLLTNGTFQLDSFGTTGAVYYVHTSTNLAQPFWQPFWTNTAPLHFEDQNTNGATKFYRLSR